MTMERSFKPSAEILGLVAFLVIFLAVSGMGGAVTATSVGTWYQTLEKPSFNPPDWVFAPVWTTLYIMMAVAGWRVWRARSKASRQALIAFALQLGLNLAWSFLFFGFRQIGLALGEVVILLIAIFITTILFWRIDWLAGALLLPYLFWVVYATLLNASLWLLN